MELDIIGWAAILDIQANIAQANIEAMAMQAANSQYPENQPYGESDFRALIDKYGIHWNSISARLFN